MHCGMNPVPEAWWRSTWTALPRSRREKTQEHMHCGMHLVPEAWWRTTFFFFFCGAGHPSTTIIHSQLVPDVSKCICRSVAIWTQGNVGPNKMPTQTECIREECTPWLVCGNSITEVQLTCHKMPDTLFVMVAYSSSFAAR